MHRKRGVASAKAPSNIYVTGPVEDGDEVIERGRCAREGYATIGFGEAAGRVLAPKREKWGLSPFFDFSPFFRNRRAIPRRGV